MSIASIKTQTLTIDSNQTNWEIGTILTGATNSYKAQILSITTPDTVFVIQQSMGDFAVDEVLTDGTNTGVVASVADTAAGTPYNFTATRLVTINNSSGENVYSINNTEPASAANEVITIDISSPAYFPDVVAADSQQVMLTTAWCTISGSGTVKVQSGTSSASTDLFWFCSSNWTEGKLGVPNIVLPSTADIIIRPVLGNNETFSIVFGLKKLVGYTINNAY